MVNNMEEIWCNLLILLLSWNVVTGMQYDTKVMKTGDDIKLSCEAEFPITWCQPGDYMSPDDLQDMGFKSPMIMTTNGTSKQSKKFVSTLEVKNASYIYTGYYHCLQKENMTSCKRRMDGVKSTYVFVEDSEKMLVPTTLKTVQVYNGDRAILPCLPTSPDVKLTLMRGAAEMPLGTKTESGLMVSYDPTMGFAMDPFTLEDSDFYLCMATKGRRNQTQYFNVKTKARPLNLLPPTIQENRTKITLKIGDSFKVDCRGIQNRALNFSLSWNIPNFSKAKEEMHPCTINIDNCKNSTLTIKSAVPNDSGTYACFVTSNTRESQVATVEIEVAGIVSGMNVTTTQPNVMQQSGNSAGNGITCAENVLFTLVFSLFLRNYV